MLLLLTLSAFKNKYIHANSLLLKYDTDKRKGEFLGSKDFILKEKPISTSGLVYSGNYLCVGIRNKSNANNDIAFFNVYTTEVTIKSCSVTNGISSIISIYPGKLYADSQNNNSITMIDFDAVNLSYFNDGIHYIIDEGDTLGINSLCNYKNTWYIACTKRKRILDLTNDRIVYSDINYPCSLFFNSNHRLCFIERGQSLLHCGDDIFLTPSNPTTCIEDYNKGGYWLACESHLYFMTHKGDITENHDLLKWGTKFNNIIEAKGRFAI
jgi:hypothetical protein